MGWWSFLDELSDELVELLGVGERTWFGLNRFVPCLPPPTTGDLIVVARLWSADRPWLANAPRRTKKGEGEGWCQRSVQAEMGSSFAFGHYSL